MACQGQFQICLDNLKILTYPKLVHNLRGNMKTILINTRVCAFAFE